MITSFTQLTLSRENLLTEIQSLKQKVLTSSNQAMILKETEKKYWNQLIDSNIRVGTMACIWCIKTQFIKRMSMAFHRWRLNSSMISWVLLNKTTTPTTKTRSSDRNHHHDNNSTSRSSYYDDDEEDGYGSINGDVDSSRLRRNSSPSLTRLIPHKGIIQKDHNLHDDDGGGVNDVATSEDDNDNVNSQDNGTITDAVQIALKIVDRYKTSSKSSSTKKKVTDIQSLLAYKDSSSVKLSPHEMKRKQLLDLSKRIANTSIVDSNTNNKSINNNSSSNSNTNNNNDKNNNNDNRGTSCYMNNTNDNRNNNIDYSRNDVNHNYFSHTLSSSLKANENSFHGNSPSRRSSSKNRNIENKKKESDENDFRRSSNRSSSPSSSSTSRTRKVTDSDHYRNNINYENNDNEFYHDSSDNNHTNHARKSINSNTSRKKDIILSSSSLSLFQITSNKHLHNKESDYRNDRIGSSSSSSSSSSSRENKRSSKSPPISSSSPLLHKSSPNNFITNDGHYNQHRQQQQHHDETNSNYGSSCSNNNNDNYDSALENIRISNKNYFSHQNLHHHVSNNDDNYDFYHDTINDDDDDDDNNINNYSNKKDDNRYKNNFTNTNSIMNNKNNNTNNHCYHHSSRNINKSNYKNFPRYLQETRSTLIKNYTNKKKFPIAAATATVASNKNNDNINNDGKYHHSRVDDRDDSRNSRSDTRSSRSGNRRGSSISNHFDHVDRCSMSNNNTITHQYQQQEQQQRYPQISASTSNSKSSSSSRSSSNVVSQRSKMDKAQVRLIYGDLDDPLNGDIWTRTLRGNR